VCESAFIVTQYILYQTESHLEDKQATEQAVRDKQAKKKTNKTNKQTNTAKLPHSSIYTSRTRST